MPASATLAIDTSGDILSLALEAESGCWYFEANAGLRHSELLMDSINMLLERAGIKPEGISGIVCMGGPGSFTGLRIAFATAKGLCLALGIPFAPIPSLDCMALPHSAWPGIVVPVIDAKRNAFFCALYRSGERLCPDMDAEPERILQALGRYCTEGEKILLTGSGAQKLMPLLGLNANQICLDTRPAQGYGHELLAIAKNTKIFDNYNTDWFSGPEYLRQEPVMPVQKSQTE